MEDDPGAFDFLEGAFDADLLDLVVCVLTYAGSVYEAEENSPDHAAVFYSIPCSAGDIGHNGTVVAE